jgi:phenylacetate-CoA ligase
MSVARMLPRFRKAYASLSEYAAREEWSRDSIEQLQLERINSLWEQAVRHVPYYRDLSQTRSIPRRFSSLQEFAASVPILPKSKVRANRGDFLSECAEPGKWDYTGGSTGTPTAVYRSHQAHQSMLRSRYRFYQMWDVDIFDRWVFLWGHAASFAPGWKGLKSRLVMPVEDWLRRRKRLSVYNLGRDDLRRYLDRIAAFKPAAIYTYSTAGNLLALEAEQVGFQCDSLKLVNLTAEPVLDYIVQSVERAFKVPAVAEYGSVECGFLAGDWPDRTLRVREDEAFLESVPRDDGRYDIIVTVLGNPSFPLLRYKIDDATDAPIEYPQHGFAILHNVAGRNIDLVQTASGGQLHGIVFEDVLEKYSAFRRWRVHQDASGSISVLIENVREVEPGVLTTLAQRLEGLVEGYEVKIELVGEIPPTPSGKHRAIISDLTSKVMSNDSELAENTV